MKPSFQTLRRKPLLALALAGAMLAGTYYHVSSADSRSYRKGAQYAAAAHVNLLASMTATPSATSAFPPENAAAAVLRAAAVSTSGLAYVPED